MKVDDLFNLKLLERHVDQGLVRAQRHPTQPLTIYCYTQRVQFTRAWDDVTRTCRGLIVADDGTVVARPFPKFFNLGEHGEDGPAGPIDLAPPVTAYDKADGCFEGRTSLSLWGGGTKTIREIVRDRLEVDLVGMDERGQLTPARVTDWHNNGRKDNWLKIRIDAQPSRRTGTGAYGNEITVTTNHHVYINGEYRPASEARDGDVIITQDWEPDECALKVIRESMLGDGCLCLSTSGATANYQESHAVQHLDYVDAIRRALGSAATQAPATTTSGYGSEMAWVRSKHYRSLVAMRREWYPEGKKRVPQDLSWLDDSAVAKWYMDDGSLSHGPGQRDRARFATNGFPREDVERLGEHLSNRYGIRYTVHKNRGWELRVGSGKRTGEFDISRLWDAIAPHVHPVMRYKLPEAWREGPYAGWDSGGEVRVARQAMITSVRSVAPTKANFRYGRTGFDVSTSTGNYMARGMLVHNSLGIGHLDAEGDFRWATKGSFASDQAEFANDLFNERVPLCDKLPFDLDPAEHTILAEIIYPENRIVVDYGRLAELRLLGAIEIATGNFTPPHDPVFDWWPWARAEVLAILGGPHDLPTLPSRPNSEGYVLVSADGVTRAKAKEDEYVRLHALLTGCTSRTVWDYLRTDTGMDRLYDTVPDEFRRWLNQQIRSIRNKKWEAMRGAFKAYRAILREMDAPAAKIRDDDALRKQFAMLATASPYRAFLFMLLDGNTTKFNAACWAAARPELELPFTGDPDDAP